MAALAGFITTATPEFTGSKEIDGARLLMLVLLWLAARIFFWASGLWGIWPALLTGLALPVSLLVLLTPPIWNAPGRKHMSFVYILAMSRISMRVINGSEDCIQILDEEVGYLARIDE